MTTAFDFDRLLASVLEADGPQSVPPTLVEAAVAKARDVPQRRPFVRALDGQAWPAPRGSVANPAARRFATIGLVVMLTLALVTAVALVGGPRRPDLVEAPAPVWAATGAMSEARELLTATLLTDGRVLVAGGGGVTIPTASAELYDPGSGTWTPTGKMIDARQFHTATRLPDGKVLVVGGNGGRPGMSGVNLSTAELYDPDTGSWTATGAMTRAHNQHVAVLLNDGTVLVAGGTEGEIPSTQAEVYDPATGSWTGTSAMTDWRASPTATLLPGGQVLVAGGFGNGIEITSAELYDPADRSWTATGAMSESRVDGTSATLLPDGRVLVAGGPRSSAESYEPVSGAWTSTASMLQGQGGHTATLLPDGTVLVAGGIDSTEAAIAFAQLYDPARGSWTATAPMVDARISGIAVPLTDGRVLVMGGIETNRGPSLTSAELFAPASTPD